MSRLRLGKKLQPAKKAWRSISNTVQSKVHKLSIQKSTNATLQRLLAIFHYLCHLITCKGHRSLTTRGSYAACSYYAYGRNIPAIHIEELFAEPASSSSSSSYVMNVHVNKNTHAQGETSRGKEVVDKKDLPGESNDIDTIEDAWKAVVAKSPMLQVDERAEEFISKFHEDMKLQKERSLLEFQQMLARSA